MRIGNLEINLGMNMVFWQLLPRTIRRKGDEGARGGLYDTFYFEFLPFQLTVRNFYAKPATNTKAKKAK